MDDSGAWAAADRGFQVERAARVRAWRGNLQRLLRASAEVRGTGATAATIDRESGGSGH